MSSGTPSSIFFEKRIKAVQAVQAVQSSYFPNATGWTALNFSRPSRPPFELVDLIEKPPENLNKPLLFKRFAPKKFCAHGGGSGCTAPQTAKLNPLSLRAPPYIGSGFAPRGTRGMHWRTVRGPSAIADSAERMNKGARGKAKDYGSRLMKFDVDGAGLRP